jgi:integrase
MKLTTDNILLTIHGEKTIQYTQQKTGKTVNTPYHPQVDAIIKKLGGFPRPISDQKYNLFIKEVCKRSGIDQITLGSRNNPTTNRKETGEFPKYELISTHIGRRSFASNHYGKFPIEILMLVTGHATVRQFLEYVGENPDLHITTLNQYYRDQIETVANLVSEK